MDGGDDCLAWLTYPFLYPFFFGYSLYGFPLLFFQNPYLETFDSLLQAR